MTFILGVIYLLVLSTGISSMAVLVFRGRQEAYNRIYLLCQGMAMVWCAAQILALLSQTETERKLSYLLGNLGICFIGSFWYYFAVLYTEKDYSIAEKYLPFVLSVFHYGMFLTNRWHHLYYRVFDGWTLEHGFFFFTNVAATYLLVFGGAFMLYRDFLAKRKGKRGRQLIIAAVMTPVLFNVLHLSGILHADFDITPMGFAISVILVLIATMKYQFLMEARELAVTNEKLALERERNRIAQQVHDTAGHTLTMLQSYMKLAMVAGENQDTIQLKEYLTQARALASDGLKELRQSINQMRKEQNSELLTQGILQLADQVKEIPVELTVQGEDSEKYSHLSGICYACVREAITNSLKYAEASRIEIILRFQAEGVELMFGDNGKGCEELSENNGIRGIRERVSGAGGTVRFVTAQGEGFLMRLLLPL